ncbi:MAG: beta-ketoacyl-[acyl-carrier-protein] synthase family protein [Planctomycetota bacterium]|nr:MAG: beta-ketoacyl-[acyl-carrier-protein] synthase family protein [Planctomycetota bacterium]
MKRRVVITGMGWVTPLGQDIETAWKRLLAGESGVAPTTLFDAHTYPTTFSAEVKGFDLASVLGEAYEKHKTASRNAGFALAAADQAWRHAGLSPADVDPEQVGVYLGAGEGPLDSENFFAAAAAGWLPEERRLDAVRWAEVAYQRLSAWREFEQEPNAAAGHIAYRFNARGPNFNTLTACAASTQALGESAKLIERGDAEVMISGGAHSMIHPLGVTGFNRLTALSTRNDEYQTASRPFDSTRDGFVLGEGAGILILEDYEFARRRGATIHGFVRGYGSTADAFRITDIHEDARGAIAAMRAALDDAQMRPEEIDYISAHGTGTEENDKLETRAIRTVFGEFAKQTPVSSVKSMLGHLVAAAGAVELITCVLAIRDGVIPPTINYRHPDPNCDLDYVPNEARPARVRVCLSNSFGFGGQNDTLIVSAPE